MIVTIKRFDIFGRKISKRIQYPPTINLKRYTDQFIDSEGKKGSDRIYDLYGVVIHCGFSSSSGHYYSYCKDLQSNWFECNDSIISRMNESSVLNQEAYLLFY